MIKNKNIFIVLAVPCFCIIIASCYASEKSKPINQTGTNTASVNSAVLSSQVGRQAGAKAVETFPNIDTSIQENQPRTSVCERLNLAAMAVFEAFD